MKRQAYVGALVLSYSIILAAFLLIAVVGSRTVTAFIESTPANHSNCIIIDAGHGGVDGGATSCTGVLESKLNLEIALCLDDVMHLLGIHTEMIRRDDISVYTEGGSIAAKKVSDLKNRVKFINSIQNATLISIHQNHFPDSKYRGAQVFYAKNNPSRDVAKKVQNALNNNLMPPGNRQIKQADGVYIMQNINCPGILVECGFISNPLEEALLRSPEYQKRLCCIIAVTMSQHLQECKSVS